MSHDRPDNARLSELLSAALDDELDVAEREELQALLDDADPHARAQAEFSDLEALLRGARDLQPPPALRDRILSRVRLPHPGHGRIDILQWLLPVARYGFAGAAGALLTLAILGGQPHGVGPLQISDLIGAMTPSEPPEVIDRFHFRDARFESELILERRNDRQVLNLFIATDEPLDITVDLAPSGLAFDALAQTEGAFASISQTRRSLSVRGAGRLRLLILLRREHDAANARKAEIAFEFSSAGELLQQGALKPTGP